MTSGYWIGKYWTENYWPEYWPAYGQYVPPVIEPPPQSSGHRKKKGAGAYVEYPKPKEKAPEPVVIGIRIGFTQGAPAFSANLEQIKISRAQVRVPKVPKLTIAWKQRKQGFDAYVLESRDVWMAFASTAHRFGMRVFHATQEQMETRPRWIEDIQRRAERERDDEEAIVAILKELMK